MKKINMEKNNKMEKVKVYVCKEADGTYSCYADEKSNLNYGLVGEGKTVQEAINEWGNVYKAMRDSYAQDGLPFIEAEFEYTYDVPSFLAYYGSLITFKGLSKVTGISASQLSHYATGYRNPSPKTVLRIQNGLRSFASELSQVSLV